MAVLFRKEYWTKLYEQDFMTVVADVKKQIETGIHQRILENKMSIVPLYLKL